MIPSRDHILTSLPQQNQQFEESYYFANMREVIEQVATQIRAHLEKEDISYKQKNLLRIEFGLKRLVLDFGKELQDIILNPLFADDAITSILKPTCNFSLKELQPFFASYVQEPEIQDLYMHKLPVDFAKLRGLDETQLELVKQRVLRHVGDDARSVSRRAFLLQMMKYTGYGYDEHPSRGKNMSKYGVYISLFAEALAMKQPTIGNILKGDRQIGHAFFMQFIDGVEYYNTHTTLAGYERKKQSLLGNEKHLFDIDETDIYEILGRQYRAEVVSQRLTKKIAHTQACKDVRTLSFGHIDHTNIAQAFHQYKQYTQGNREKVQKLLVYITDYLGYTVGQSKVGFHCAQLAEHTGVNRQLYEQIFNTQMINPETALLRTLVAVADANTGNTVFSQAVFKEVRQKLREEQRELKEQEYKPMQAYVQSSNFEKDIRELLFRAKDRFVHTSDITSFSEGDIATLQNTIDVELLLPSLWRYCQDDMERYRAVFDTAMEYVGVLNKNGTYNYSEFSRMLGQKGRWYHSIFRQIKEPNVTYLAKLLLLLAEYNRLNETQPNTQHPPT